jgi:hypothetical protein
MCETKFQHIIAILWTIRAKAPLSGTTWNHLEEWLKNQK